MLSETGQTIAHGEDVLTWQEVRLAALDRIEVDLGGDPGEALPLQLGGVRAGRLRMVAGTGGGSSGLSPSGATRQPAPRPLCRLALCRPTHANRSHGSVPLRTRTDADDTLPPAAPPAPVSPEVAEMENADTELMFLPPPEPEGRRSPGSVPRTARASTSTGPC